MKRWLVWVIGLLLALSAGVAVRSHVKSEAKKRRDVAYEAVLSAYAQHLTPGMPRKQVEEYLRARGAPFTQMCCLQQRTLADLVKIGEEDAPWYCSEYRVHIAFDFAAIEPHDSLEAYDSDILKTITIFRQFGGCL